MTEFLALVSKPEIRWKNSRARLEARDWKKEILVLVSKHEIERKKISISSRSVRPEERNSRSRLGHEIERQIFSIPSRKLKQGSRWTLISINTAWLWLSNPPHRSRWSRRKESATIQLPRLPWQGDQRTGGTKVLRGPNSCGEKGALNMILKT